MIRIDNPLNIGVALAQVRHMLGISQRQLCAQTGQHQNSLAAWETGAMVPDLRSVIRVAQALGFDLALVPRESDTVTAEHLELP